MVLQRFQEGLKVVGCSASDLQVLRVLEFGGPLQAPEARLGGVGAFIIGTLRGGRGEGDRALYFLK